MPRYMPAAKSKLGKMRDGVLLSLFRGEKPPTRRNDVIAPLAQAALIRVKQYHLGGSAKEVKLTETGRIVASRLAEQPS